MRVRSCSAIATRASCRRTRSTREQPGARAPVSRPQRGRPPVRKQSTVRKRACPHPRLAQRHSEWGWTKREQPRTRRRSRRARGPRAQEGRLDGSSSREMVALGHRLLGDRAYHRVMRQATLARGRLAEHPVWSRALARADLAGRVILPVIVGSAVEDREKIEAAPWLERLSLT